MTFPVRATGCVFRTKVSSLQQCIHENVQEVFRQNGRLSNVRQQFSKKAHRTKTKMNLFFLHRNLVPIYLGKTKKPR